jgi:hypothetical protein
VLSTATPSAAPTCCVVLNRPEVTPAIDGSAAADMASVIIAGNASPKPPIRSIVGSRYPAYVPKPVPAPPEGNRSSRAIPAAIGTRPQASIAAGLNRAFSRADAPMDSPAIATADGSIASPARAGPYPRTRCMYWGISTWNPNAAATASAWTALDTDTCRERNTRSGSNGARARPCRTTNPASSTTAPPKSASERADTHPCAVVPAIA